MRIAFKTDVGRHREINEDSMLVDAEKGIFLLADGLGGHQAGEVASELCVKTIHSYLNEMIDKVPVEEVPDLLMDAVVHAHETIKEKSRSDPDLMGMGTTVVAMVIKGLEAYICHAGDSRAYIIRNTIKQITRDHTATGYCDDDAMLRRLFFQKHTGVLSRAVGIGAAIEPEINHIRLLKGDIVLICSDGLTNMLSDEEISGIALRHEENLNEAAVKLVDEANKRGGRDNISVILVRTE
ncbi:MAG: serine/threonine-protein phosphatase [Deltaproteobacteria bacterium]|nr:serine/threonine-protein phosphatase [Deltaproteobacteria bacterium]